MLENYYMSKHSRKRNHNKTLMSLVPTVCGAVKFLQVKNGNLRRLHYLGGRKALEREGLKIAKDAIKRALAKRVLEMTPAGNFRLKMLADSVTSDQVKKMFPRTNRKKSRITSKAKSKSVTAFKRSTKKKNPRSKQSKFQKIIKLISCKSGEHIHKIRDRLQKHYGKSQRKVKSKPAVQTENTDQKKIENTNAVTKIEINNIDINNNNNDEKMSQSPTKNIKKHNSMKPTPVNNREVLDTDAHVDERELSLPLKKRLRRHTNLISTKENNTDNKEVKDSISKQEKNDVE